MVQARLLILFVMAVMLSACYPKERVMKLSSSTKEAKELFNQARQLFQEHKNVRAREMLNEAIRLDQNFAVAYAELGGEENVKKAMELIDQITLGEELFIRYKWATITMNIEEEISCLERMSALLPDDPWPHYYLGLAYALRKPDRERSASSYLRALEIDPTHIISLNRLAYTYMFLKEDDLAEESFLRYIDIAPHVANAYDSYAEFLISRQRYDEALPFLEKWLEVDPQWVQGKAKIGELYAFKGMHEKAIAYYDEALEEVEGLNMIRYINNWKAGSLYSLGAYDKVVELFDDLGDLLHAGGEYVYEVDRYEYPLLMSLFKKDYDKVLYFAQQYADLVEANLSHYPEPNVIRFSATIRLALGHGLTGNKRVSDNLLSDAGQMVFDLGLPDLANKWYQTILGWLEIHRGNFEQAIVCFETDQLDILPVKYWLGYAYQQAGDEKAAEELFSEIRSYYSYVFTYALCLGEL